MDNHLTMHELSFGSIDTEIIDLIIKCSNIELTYVDENDVIRYYTDIPNLIFSRNPKLIGTSVVNCHSEGKREIVHQLLDDFRHGRKDIQEQVEVHDNRKILVKYIAIRDGKNRYRGVLETVQDITKYV